jgi:hypothetical protein
MMSPKGSGGLCRFPSIYAAHVRTGKLPKMAYPTAVLTTIRRTFAESVYEMSGQLIERRDN